MKTDVKARIKRFAQSEDGRVAIKAPLTLGVAMGATLLAQMMLTPHATADIRCNTSYPDCAPPNGAACCRTNDGVNIHQHCTTTEDCNAMGGTII